MPSVLQDLVAGFLNVDYDKKKTDESIEQNGSIIVRIKAKTKRRYGNMGLCCDLIGLEGQKAEQSESLNALKRSGQPIMLMVQSTDNRKVGDILRVIQPVLLDDWKLNLIDGLYVSVFSNDLRVYRP